MVDYFPVSQNRKFPEPDPKPEAEEYQEELHPTVDVVLNVYREKNNAQSIAVRISFRLPDKA